MPIPALNEHGLLPAGIHDCTLDELKSRFGSFQISDRRNQLFEGSNGLWPMLKPRNFPAAC